MQIALENFLTAIQENIINPIYIALDSTSPFDSFITFISTIISFILNLFREEPVGQIHMPDLDAYIDLSIIFQYSEVYLIVANIIGIIFIIFIFRFIISFIKFFIDLIFTLVKDIQREMKINYYLKNKKGGHKQLWLKN